MQRIMLKSKINSGERFITYVIARSPLKRQRTLNPRLF